MNTRIEHRNVDDLKFAPFNPEHRISDKYIEDLVLSMKEEGFWPWNPIHITIDNVVADGNRRLAAARKAGIKSIPAIVVNNSIGAEEIWGKINDRKNIASKDVLEAYVKGLPLNYIRPHRVSIEKIKELGGDELVHFIQENGVSPSIVTYASTVAYRVGRKDDKEFIVKLIRWMITWRSQYIVRFLISNGGDMISLCKHVEENLPIQIIVSSIP